MMKNSERKELLRECVERSASNDSAEANSRGIAFIPYAAAFIFLAAFAVYALFSRKTELAYLIIGGLSLLFFAVIMMRCIGRFITGRDGARMTEYGERSKRHLHQPVRVIAFSLAAQLLIIVAVYAVSILRNGITMTLPSAYKLMFYRSASSIFGANTVEIFSSIGLLSFVFPGGIEGIVSNNALVLAFSIASALAVAAGAVFLHELMLVDYDQKIARISVAAYHLLPSIFLLLQPMSGTTFFFALAVLCLLLARHGRLVSAGIVGLFSCLFNIFGALLAVSVFFEARAYSPVFALKAEKDGTKRSRRHYLAALIPLLGAAAAVALKLSGINGLSAFSQKPIWFFEPIGRLISQWGGAELTKMQISIHIVSLLFAGIVYLICSSRTRSSVNGFTLLMFAIAPAFLSADLTSFAVFSCPFLAVYVASRCKFRPLRVIISTVLIAVLLLFIAFLYIAKA